MKTIMLMFDSLNRHFLSPYGCDWTDTPNFQRLAEKTVTFDTHYAGSLPCIPARREMHTGRYNFLHRSWGPLEPFDNSLFEVLKGNGIYSHLITDHHHYWEDGGATYHTRYNTFEFVRGQEADRWKADVKGIVEPKHLGNWMEQDAINRKYLKGKKLPLDKVFSLTFDFLEKNKRSEDWFLQIECFDPHEPYFDNEENCSYYQDGLRIPLFDWPNYDRVYESVEEVSHIRSKYASMLSLIDKKLGELIDYMDKEDMWKDTALIVNTDHGFLLGEHNLWAKCVHPFFEEVSHIPLFIWNPELKVKNERRNQLTRTIDLAPTILDLNKLEKPPQYQGSSLNKVIYENSSICDFALFGMHGAQINITDGRYVFMKSPVKKDNVLFNYTLMPMHMKSLFTFEELLRSQLYNSFEFTGYLPILKVPVMREGDGHVNLIGDYEDQLYDLQIDPQQLIPVIDPDLEQIFKFEMAREMDDNEAPIEQYERLGLMKEYKIINEESD
ncbi:sulfatase [Vagococcus elongatus]|uniref:Sulfatase n=1 Tax=Vagococcus elongatus TaxID=180344 RepID=A0A430AHV0_9ENTE|nr:sulfatase [Vagococcus elongatus]RSU07655.1 sulfatase [Vagococcus elongatus]